MYMYKYIFFRYIYTVIYKMGSDHFIKEKKISGTGAIRKKVPLYKFRWGASKMTIRTECYGQTIGFITINNNSFLFNHFIFRQVLVGAGTQNLPMQYTDFFSYKNSNFHWKCFDIFNTYAQNIDCWYTLEPPPRGGPNEYPQYVLDQK